MDNTQAILDGVQYIFRSLAAEDLQMMADAHKKLGNFHQYETYSKRVKEHRAWCDNYVKRIANAPGK